MSMKKRFSGVFSFGKDSRRAASLDLPDGTSISGGANLTKSSSLREKPHRLTEEARSVSSPDLGLIKDEPIAADVDVSAETEELKHDGKGSFRNLRFLRKSTNNPVRHSLAAVLYATPHQQIADNDGTQASAGGSSARLVPVLVTNDLADKHVIVAEPIYQSDSPTGAAESMESSKRTSEMEYDNILHIEEDGHKVVWQGYGYTTRAEEAWAAASQYDRQIYEDYCGLIHPIYVFEDDARAWEEGLDVTELVKFFNHYGVMMMRVREAKIANIDKRSAAGESAGPIAVI